MLINGKLCIPVDGLLTPDECAEFIKNLDDPAKIKPVDSGTAQYDRNFYNSQEFAAVMFERIKKYLPASVQATGICNPVFRFSKYHDGQEFKLHQDGFNQDAKTGFRTKYTVNIFLNTEFEGGQTLFFEDSKNLVFKAEPAVGRGVIFDREVWHSGALVKNGYKYLLRTDVMLPNGL